jgi:peptide/nickel transport system ATP-binding protein
MGGCTMSESESENENILEVHNLNVYYGKGRKKHQVLKNVDFTMRSGEILGLVGESGCGKTTLSKTILGLLKDKEGSIQLNAEHPQMIFQDPFSSLNPSKTIGWILEEPL